MHTCDQLDWILFNSEVRDTNRFDQCNIANVGCIIVIEFITYKSVFIQIINEKQIYFLQGPKLGKIELKTKKSLEKHL